MHTVSFRNLIPMRSRNLFVLGLLGASAWCLSGGLGSQFQLTQEASAQGDRGGERGGRGGGERGGRGGGERGERGGRGGGERGGRGGGGGGGGWGGRGGGGGGMRDIQEMLQPDFMRRDVPIFVDQLALDDTQEIVLETLFDDYESDFELRSDEIQTELRDLGRQMFQSMMPQGFQERMGQQWRDIRDEMDEIEAEEGEITPERRRELIRERMTNMQEELQAEREEQGMGSEMNAAVAAIFDMLQEWTVEKAAMRERFVGSLKTQLDDDQLAAWAAFNRFLVREKSLPRSRLSGEGANLFFAIDEFELEDADFDRIESLFDDYEISLHEALVSRDRFLETSAPKLYRALQQGSADEAKRIVERQVDYRKAIRDVNERYIQIFSAAVAENDQAVGAAFSKAMNQAAHESIYRATRTERAFEIAMTMDLDPEVMSAVTDLSTAYETELTSMNEKIYRAVRKQEPKDQLAEVDRMSSFLSGNFMGAMGNRWGGGDEENPVREAYDKRSELDTSYYERLSALLTPEQLEELPAPRGGRRGEGGRGGRGDRERGGQGGGNQSFNMDRMPEEVRQRLTERYDTDGDGTLSEAEMEAVREQFRGRGGGGRGGPGGNG